MEKKLRQAGSSYTLVIPKAILELLSIDPTHDLVKLRVEGDNLIITKGSTYED